jgi:SAM-dependent methyltransferase
VTADRCVACGDELMPWVSAQSTEPALTEPFRLLRCEGCGTAVTGGAPVAGLHESGVYAGATPRGMPLVGHARMLFVREKLAILRSVGAPPASVLDIGAGRGAFVAGATASGYRATGLEPGPSGESAQATNGIIRATLEDAAIPEGSIDVATMWHVLEHLDRPAESLELVSRWLRPGGALIVAVPNLGSWQARLGGRRWFHLDVPRHRAHYTPAGLSAVLQRAGLAPVRHRRLLLEHTYYGMAQTVMNRFTDQQSYLYNAIKRNATLLSPDLGRTILCLPLIPVAAVIELLGGLTGHGGAMVFVARRVK